MIKIEVDKGKNGVEIILNTDGIDELIGYLNFIRDSKESIHLTAGNELDETSSPNGNSVVKHLKIVSLD